MDFPPLVRGCLSAWGVKPDDLPAYVVIPDPRGVPAGGSINWTNGFLPAQHQGVSVKSSGTPIQDIFPAKMLPADTETASRTLLAELNQRHLAERGESDMLTARIRSYQLSDRMQSVVPQVTNLATETESTHALYGTENDATKDFGRSCLMARRLLERGVRYVQLFSRRRFRPATNQLGRS